MNKCRSCIETGEYSFKGQRAAGWFVNVVKRRRKALKQQSLLDGRTGGSNNV